MRLQRIEDLREPPVVGRFYLVPCVLYWYDFRLRWWPVVGPRHDDIEHLDFAAAHYHLDRRFLPERMLRGGSSVPSTTGVRLGFRIQRSADTMIAARPLSEFPAKPNPYAPGADYGGPMPAPVHRRRRCIVADVGFPGLPDAGVHGNFDRFHEAYVGRRCGRNAEGHLVCPHKGAVLSSLAPDCNGVVTCPLHGLTINVQTGVVVPRPRVGGRHVR